MFEISSSDRIRIHLPSLGSNPADRVYISDGNQGADHARVDLGCDVPYEQGARVPLNDWRTLSNSEHVRITTDIFAPATPASTWILRLPKEILEPLFQLGVHRLARQEDANRFWANPETIKAAQPLVSYARQLTRRDENFKIQGICTRVPGLGTTTVDTSRGVRIGIHVDSWDRAVISLRERARNRLNVNLGKGNRYLLLVNARVDAMARFLYQQSGNPIEMKGVTAITRAFLASRPEFPIYKVCIKPNEAYIAPTELLPHDATTVGKDEPDVSLTFLGYFDGGLASQLRASS